MQAPLLKRRRGEDGKFGAPHSAQGRHVHRPACGQDGLSQDPAIDPAAAVQRLCALGAANNWGSSFRRCSKEQRLLQWHCRQRRRQTAFAQELGSDATDENCSNFSPRSSSEDAPRRRLAGRQRSLRQAVIGARRREPLLRGGKKRRREASFAANARVTATKQPNAQPPAMLASTSSDELDGEEPIDEDDALSSGNASSDSEDHAVPTSYLHEEERLLKPGPLQPGDSGFKAYASLHLAECIGKSAGEPGGNCPPLQPHQEAVALLLHPLSPVQRLLIDQPTGSGKTREMILVLNQFFYDRRPKVPIFPRAAVCRNFYEELLRWPSLYRDFFGCVCPAHAALAAGLGEGGDWKQRRHDRWIACSRPPSENPHLP